MPRPSGIVCNLCGGEFFKSSYPIHRKKCEKKFVQCNTQCDYCGRMVANQDINTHIGDCRKRHKGKTLAQREAALKRKQAALVKKAAADAGLDPNSDVDSQIRAMERKLQALKAAQNTASKAVTNDPNAANMRTGKKIDLMAEIEKAANTIESAPGACEDGRLPCSSCGRKFNADRIVVHEDICLRNKERRAQRKNKIKVKTGEELRLKDTEFAKYVGRREEVEVQGKDWRDEAEKLHQIVKAGRNVVRFQRAGVPLAELPPADVDVSLSIGVPVMTNDGRRGVVKFVGDVLELPGDNMGSVRTFIGVEFNRAVGQNDGSINGNRYFDGRPGHCSFMRPAKLLRVQSELGNDIKTNVKRRKNGFQKQAPPAKETMTLAQRNDKKRAAKQAKKDSAARRAAQIAASRAARGEEIGQRLREKREQARREREAQLAAEAAAEAAGETKVRSSTAPSVKRPAQSGAGRHASSRDAAPEAPRSRTPSPMSPTLPPQGETKQPQRRPNPKTPEDPPVSSRPRARAALQQKRQPGPPQQQQQRSRGQNREQQNMPSKLRREVSDARRRPKRRQDPSSSSSQRPRQQRAPPSIPETVRGGSAQNRSRPAMAKRSKQSSAAAAAAARRVRAARSNQKENSRPPQRAVKGQVGWGDPRKKTERKKPYGDSGVSDATRKYREKKAAGSNLDMDSASAVYKARMRAKKSRRKKGALPSYVDSVDPNSLAAKAAKAKQAAKGKAAFGSGAGSVADDLNEHVFGKGKVKRQMYTADGKTKQLAGASVKAKLKGEQRGGSSSSSAGAGASRRSSPRTQGASPRQPAANPVSMGSNGRKLGGSRIKSQTTDPRELRLRALAARGLA